jgi:hypothetical protein
MSSRNIEKPKANQPLLELQNTTFSNSKAETKSESKTIEGK